MSHDVLQPDTPSLAASDAPIWRQVILLGWPVLVQQLLGFSVMIYDAWLAGRFELEHGEQTAAQSAQTTALYLGWFLVSYAFLVTVGSTALVARFTGARDRASAVHVTNQALLLAVFLGAAGSLFGLIYLEELLALLQLRSEAALFAADYLRPLFAILVFQMVEVAGIACLVGAGDTRTGL